MNIKTIGLKDILLKIIEKYNFSMSFLADLLDCSLSYLNLVINGKRTLSKSYADKLNKYLLDKYNTSLEEILFSYSDDYFYHGSKLGLVGEINPHYSLDSSSDFGQGFYIGESLKQSATFICDGPHNKGTIYRYSLKTHGLKIKVLKDKEWVLFIAYNRGLIDFDYDTIDLSNDFKDAINNKYDIIVGDIADDKMFAVMNMFFTNAISLEVVIECLKNLGIGKQYCLKTKKACKALTLIDEIKIDDDLYDVIYEYTKKMRNTAVESANALIKNARQGTYYADIIK